MITKEIKQTQIKKEDLTPLSQAEFREQIMIAQERMPLKGDALDKACPLKHSFGDGVYVREIFNPKGMLLITKIHKIAHPFFLLKGDMSILTEEGVKRIKAPYHGITPAGTKRIIYAHEDIVFVTVHVTNKTDPKEIEEDIIAKDFTELDAFLNKDIIDVKEG